MTFNDIIKKSALDLFQNSNVSTTHIVITLTVVLLIATYIFFVYKLMTRQVFYNKNFNISMSVVSLITAGIVLAMQSNLVISLGMVGALSIIRFRTAIKEPMDLLFLFWSISVGMICGAGVYELAVVMSAFVTVGILLFQMLPVQASPYLFIINADDETSETAIIEEIKKYSKKYRIDSKNLSQSGMDLIFEIYSKEHSELLNKINKVEGVRRASYLYHEGEVKN